MRDVRLPDAERAAADGAAADGAGWAPDHEVRCHCSVLFIHTERAAAGGAAAAGAGWAPHREVRFLLFVCCVLCFTKNVLSQMGLLLVALDGCQITRCDVFVVLFFTQNVLLPMGVLLMALERRQVKACFELSRVHGVLMDRQPHFCHHNHRCYFIITRPQGEPLCAALRGMLPCYQGAYHFTIHILCSPIITMSLYCIHQLLHHHRHLWPAG